VSFASNLIFLCGTENIHAKFQPQIDFVLTSDFGESSPAPPLFIKHGLLPTVSNFSGRSNYYLKLQNYFEKDEQNLIAIVGPGGMGKSELARKFVNDIWKAGKANCIWLGGSSTSVLTSDLHQLAKKLEVPIQSSENNLDITEMVRAILEKINGRLILILDNVDERSSIFEDFISTCLERDGIFIIITSRLTTILADGGEAIELSELSVEESRGIFLRSPTFNKSVIDEESLNTLCTQFDGFPLALQQSISYIIQQRRGRSLKAAAYGIQDYVTEYEKIARQLLDWSMSKLFNKYELTTYTTWIVSTEKIKESEYGNQALALMDTLAYLDPDRIEFEFLKQMEIPFEHRKNENYEYSTKPLDQRRGEKLAEEILERGVLLLREYSLITLSSEILKIHRLIQKVTRLRLQEEGQSEFVLCCLCNWAKLISSLSKNGIKLKPYVGHLRSIWDNIAITKNHSFIKEFKPIPIAIRLHYFNSYEMLTEFEFVKELHDTTFVPYLHKEDKDAINIFIQLSKAYELRGDLESALETANKVLPKIRKVYGPSHPDTLFVVEMISDILLAQKKFDKALEIYSHVNFKELNETDRVRIAKSHGEIYLKLGDLVKAEICLHHCLNYFDKHLQEGYIQEYIETAQVVAGCLEFQPNGFEKAYQLLQSSDVRIDELKRTNAVLVKNVDFFMLSDLKVSIAENRRRVQNTDEFFQILDQLIESANEYYGPNSLLAVKAKSRKAHCLANEMKRYSEAVVIFEEILPLCRLKTGKESEAAITIERELLRGKYFMGSREEALPELKKLCFTLESKWGKEHQQLNSTRLTIVECLRHGGQNNEALEILTDILEQQMSTSPHFKTVEMSNIELQIAEIKFAKGDTAPLLENFKQVMKNLKLRGFKATHPLFLEFKESLNKLPDIDGVPVYKYLLKQAKTKVLLGIQQ